MPSIEIYSELEEKAYTFLRIRIAFSEFSCSSDFCNHHNLFVYLFWLNKIV